MHGFVGHFVSLKSNTPLMAKPIPFILVLVSLCFVAEAQTNRTFSTTGNWNVATNWTGSNIADVIGERATINTGLTATIISPNSYTIARIDINASGTVTVNSGATLNIGTSGTANNFFMADNTVLNVYGNVTIYGDLNVQDDVTIRVYSTGTLTINDDLISGDNIAIIVDNGGTLNVTSDINIGDGANLVVNGDITVGNDIDAQDNFTMTIGATGSLDINDDLNVFDNATIVVNGVLDVADDVVGENNFNLTIGTTGDAIIGNNLDILDDGAIAVSGDLTIVNDFIADDGLDIIVNPTGNLDIQDDVVIDDNADIIIDGNMYVGDNFTGDDNTDFNVDGLVVIGGDLTVDNGSDATGSGTISVGGACSDGASVNFCGTGPLPVTLVSFEVQNEANEVRCTWSTATEINFSHFELEHSLDGINWKSISRLDGAGTSHQLRYYEATHRYPSNGKNYYRLKMIDRDEALNYSSIEAIELQVLPRVGVFPNPVINNQLTVWSNFVPDEGDRVIISDVVGKPVAEVPIQKLNQELVLPELNAGVYFIRYLGRNQNLVERFIVR